MSKQSEQIKWEEKQKGIIKIFEEQGLKPDLQMLKIWVMGFGYSALYNAENDEKIKEIIERYNLKSFDDAKLISEIEQLEEQEQKVIKTRYGIEKDGIMITSKATGKILGIGTRDVNKYKNNAIEQLSIVYKTYKKGQSLNF